MVFRKNKPVKVNKNKFDRLSDEFNKLAYDEKKIEFMIQYPELHWAIAGIVREEEVRREMGR